MHESLRYVPRLPGGQKCNWCWRPFASGEDAMCFGDGPAQQLHHMPCWLVHHVEGRSRLGGDPDVARALYRLQAHALTSGGSLPTEEMLAALAREPLRPGKSHRR